MRIVITTTNETAKYAVQDGKIYFVKLSKPCAVGDLDDQFAKPDISPYADKRTLSYGVFVDDMSGYSCKPVILRKVNFESSQYAHERFDVWSEKYECGLTWEEAKKLAGWEG